MALATSALMAQDPATPVQEEPDRVQMRMMSRNPSGTDIPTGYDKSQVVNTRKPECKDHKDGQPCTKPADQQCDDCKAKAATPQKLQRSKAEGQQCKKAEGMKHECKEGKKECDKAAGMKHECKEGKKECDKAAGMKHECKEGKKECDKAAGMKHECKEGKKQCDKAAGMKHECKEGKKQCDKAAAETKDCCKDKKMEGKKCDKPADQQCPDCKEAAKKN